MRKTPIGVDVAWVGQWSPPVSAAPSILVEGVGLRAWLGTGRIRGIAGAAFLPAQPFAVDDHFHGRLLRASTNAGVRLRWRFVEAIEVAADAAIDLAYERYEGITPHAPMTAARLSPGVQVALSGYLCSLKALAALLTLNAEWLPFQQDLEALPNPLLGRTPTLWLGGGLGLSFGPW